MRRRTAAEVRTGRFDVRSADGTQLAVWVDGDGPPLVLVHGSLSDHTTFDPLVDELRNGVATFSMDRRGFGASGDAAGYAIEREFEDVAAVVEAVAARTGGPAALCGHTYGAGCAMGGATLTNNVHHLVLVGHVMVERHGLDPERLAELAHGERPDHAVVGEGDGGVSTRCLVRGSVRHTTAECTGDDVGQRVQGWMGRGA